MSERKYIVGEDFLVLMDKLNGAIRRILVVQPDKMTEAAAELEDLMLKVESYTRDVEENR